MNNRGFSLIELLVVIVIIGILALLLGSSFQGSMAANRVENQIKEMHTDLMNARARAIQRNRRYFVVINTGVNPNTYQVTEDTNQSGGVAPDGGDTALFTTPKIFSDAVVWGGDTIIFNSRGVINSDPGGVPVTFEISKDMSTSTVSDYDCIQLSQTRINIGRMSGGICEIR